MFSFLASFFSNPALIGGAAAGSIPVIIHLLNRQRFKKVIWAAMHWLWASYKKSQRRLQIEQLILLLIRILIIVLLALALARPALQEGIGLISGRASTHRVIVLDNSYSMGQLSGGKPLFDKAKQLARELTDRLSLSDEVDVLLANGLIEELTAKSSSSKEEIRNLIAGAALSDGGTDIPRAIAAACRVINERKSKNARKEIIVITDQTRAGWEHDHQPRRISGDDETAVSAAFGAGKSRPRVVIMRVAGEKDPDNLAAARIEIDEKVVPARVETQLLATISSFASSSKSTRVKLKVDGEEAPTENSASITAERPEVVAFRHTFAEPGSHTVSIELDGDILPSDNAAHLAIDVEEQVKVLCVDGEQRTDANASETSFFAQALSPSKAEEINAGKTPLLPEIISDSAFPEANLDNYRLVVLANVAQIPPEKILVLEQYVRRGGSLWIFTGGKVDANIYNRDMAEMLPMNLGEIVGVERTNDNTDAPSESLSDKDASHPAIAKLKSSKFPSLSHLRTYRRFKFVPKGKEDPTVRTVLSYENGEPAAVEKSLGEGRVIVFGTTADKAWNDWPLKSQYLPLMSLIALDLIQPSYLQRNRLYGERFIMQLPHNVVGAARREGIRLIDPQGEPGNVEVLTEQSRIESAVIRKAGIYSAELPGEVKRTLHFAANRNIEESDLSTIEEREIMAGIPRSDESDRGFFKALVRQDDLSLIGEEAKDVEEKLKSQAGSREIWRWLAGTVLALLFVESFLAKRFGDFTR